MKKSLLVISLSLLSFLTGFGLVMDNLVMYRERDRQTGFEPMKDGISCWRGTTKLWNRDFPPDAELLVSGKRILAITKSKNGIYVNEIEPPPSKSE